MRYKKRYILAYVDAASLHGYGDYHKTIIKRIRDAYAERFGREELDHARISLVCSKSIYGKGNEENRKGEEEGEERERGGGRQMLHASNRVEEKVEYDDTQNVRRRNLYTHGRMMLFPVIVRCNLEYYAHVMHILSTLGIRTVKTSGTLKALRKREVRQGKNY
ncbi:MAG: hypothetical protein QW574_01905 [Candidatus Nitrosocaldus sp.]